MTECGKCGLCHWKGDGDHGDRDVSKWKHISILKMKILRTLHYKIFTLCIGSGTGDKLTEMWTRKYKSGTQILWARFPMQFDEETCMYGILIICHGCTCNYHTLDELGWSWSKLWECADSSKILKEAYLSGMSVTISALLLHMGYLQSSFTLMPLSYIIIYKITISIILLEYNLFLWRDNTI